MKVARYILSIVMLLMVTTVGAQRFYNLTADDVEVDTIMPVVSFNMPLPANYADSVYEAEILYPEFVDLSEYDRAIYDKFCGDPLPELPQLQQSLVFSKKVPSLLFSFSPYVLRNGKFQALVSYMLKVTAKAKARDGRRKLATAASMDRYAEHSVLASGQWAKISVEKTGFTQLTESVIKKAGFTDINKVRIYGYGGNMVPEKLTDSYLRETDDLKEIPSCMLNGRRLFYAKGPVSWSSNTETVRTRNPYSSVGCYFITQTDEEPTLVSEETLLETNYPSAEDYHTLYESDGYSWYNGGRNLVDATSISSGSSRTYKIAPPVAGVSGSITVCVTAKEASTYQIDINGTTVGSGSMSIADHDKCAFSRKSFKVDSLLAENTIKVTSLTGGILRLDYISCCTTTPAAEPNLANGTFQEAQYVYNITNQDHHADENVDMTIIIPTSQSLLEQAQRIKTLHETNDGLTVRIVPADELYNEFSSGTPDVSAYRRYMKMMYDRATTESEQPKYLLLFGDCVWDNRLLTSECKLLNADDLLLCFESENSSNEINCFVSDDFLGMLDDDEQISIGSSYTGTPDIGVGRFPVASVAAAKAVVDKEVNYVNNANVGAWQNTIMFMGDDGNDNLHMTDINALADEVISGYPGYYIRKVLWDAYNRTSSSTGNRYPDVEDAIKTQQQTGALIMDYAGHGSSTAISGEYVLRRSDFASFNNANLPLWVTASCEIGPFDGPENTIGEDIILNSDGGGVAFFGTARTVYANYNKYINTAFIERILTVTDGKRTTLGDANMQAKTWLVTSGKDKTVNKLQYCLLGDPALALNVPVSKCVVDSINGYELDEDYKPTISANSKVRLSGHIEVNGEEATTFNGRINVLVRDSRELRTCLNNAGDVTPLQFYDRTKKIFSGNDSVRSGRFEINFAVPRDINYSNESGLITLFAYTNDGKITAHGESDDFLVGGSETIFNDSIGPSVYCYLNSTSFQNGGDVNSTPYFVAEVTDKDGINASGSGIGHDLQLVIDNDISKTYVLNDNFQYDFGTYTSGSTYYSIPELSAGTHTLRFRAWDILNNPTTTTLTFNVVSALEPQLFDVDVTRNPAKDSTTFIITHDRPGSDLSTIIEIFDMSGRLLHKITDASTAGSSTSTVTWNLSTDTGGRLQTGVYLYRVRISSDNSSQVSKAKKLIIVNN